MTGRRLRARVSGVIHVFVAVSEPLDVDGEIVVRLLSLPDYSKAAYGVPPNRVTVLPLHQLWAY